MQQDYYDAAGQASADAAAERVQHAVRDYGRPHPPIRHAIEKAVNVHLFATIGAEILNQSRSAIKPARLPALNGPAEIIIVQ